MLDTLFSKSFMIKCSRISSLAVVLYIIYDHHIWQDMHRSALDLWKEKAENLTTILHSQELISSLASWCFQFSSDPNNPLKTTPETSLTIIADSWERAKCFPSPDMPGHSPSQQKIWSALRCGHQRQPCPTRVDARIWTSFEKLLSEKRA